MTHLWLEALKLAVLAQDDESAQRMKLELLPLLKVVERTQAKTKTTVQGKESQGHTSPVYLSFDSLSILGAEGDLLLQDLGEIVFKQVIHIYRP